MSLRLSLLAATLVLFSCGKELPKLNGIDTEKWKADKNGCLHLRQPMEKSIRMEISKLKGLSEMNIIELLGRPDENELYKRNQKFYYYYLTAGPGCTSPDSTSLRVVLRFNAMGYAQLVSIE